jgi:hypothetical protein
VGENIEAYKNFPPTLKTLNKSEKSSSNPQNMRQPKNYETIVAWIQVKELVKNINLVNWSF